MLTCPFLSCTGVSDTSFHVNYTAAAAAAAAAHFALVEEEPVECKGKV